MDMPCSSSSSSYSSFSSTVSLYTPNELKQLLKEHPLYHKWYNRWEAQSVATTKTCPVNRQFFQLLMGGRARRTKKMATKPNCQLSQQDLLYVLDYLSVRPKTKRTRDRFDKNLVDTLTQLLQKHPSQPLNVNCTLLTHFFPAIKPAVRRATRLSLHPMLLDKVSFKQLVKMARPSDDTRRSKQWNKLLKPRVLLDLGASGGYVLQPHNKRSKQNKPTIFGNTLFQTFDRRRFIQSLHSMSFPESIKKKICHQLPQSIAKLDPNSFELQLNQNVRDLLGQKYASANLTIDRMYGVGAMGITFGVRVGKKQNKYKALKVVFEDDPDLFQMEKRMHQRFNSIGLAPRMSKSIFNDNKRRGGLSLLAYTMDKIDGVLNPIFSARLPHPESLRLIVQIGTGLVRLIRSAAQHHLCHGDMHGGNIGFVRDRQGRLKHLWLIDFGWSVAFGRKTNKKEWPFSDYKPGGWPMLEMVQFLRGGVINLYNGMIKDNVPEWLLKNVHKPLNRLILVCGIFLESFVEGFRSWLLGKGSGRRFNKKLRLIFKRPRTLPPPDRRKKPTYFVRSSRSEADLLRCALLFLNSKKEARVLQKKKVTSKTQNKISDMLDRLIAHLDKIFLNYFETYKQLYYAQSFSD